MKGIKTLIKMSKRTLDELRRKMVDLENEKAQLVMLQQKLEQEMLREMQIAAQSLEARPYLMRFAKAHKARQLKVGAELVAMDKRIETLASNIALAFSELKKYEIAEENERLREEEEAKRKDTLALDEVAAQQHRRRHVDDPVS